MAAPHPELAGYKVRLPGMNAIYVIDSDGYRRFIPFPATFINLFEDRALLNTLVTTGLTDIAEGPALEEGALLLRGRSCERIYLLDQGKKRLITSQRVMHKYQFSEEAIVVVPKIVIDALPEGEIWE